MTYNIPLNADDISDNRFNRFNEELIDRYFNQEGKMAIEADRKKHELEARIDALEYAKISPKFKIEERVEAFKQELEKL